jgi:flagellar L-ring protein FlgH
MNRRFGWAFALVGLSIQVCHADSIWDRREPRSAYLFQDNRARNVGDIITISISESTAENEREQRQMDRRTRNNGALNYSLNYNLGAGNDGTANARISNDTDNRRRFDGSAQTTNTRTFVDRLAVTVVDVMPNGNLVFEGQRSRVMAGEERILRVTGVVRPADIGASNTVQSQFIANFRVSYTGRGAQSEFSQQPWIGRVFNWLLP